MNHNQVPKPSILVVAGKIENQYDTEIRPCLVISKLETEKIDESGNYIVTYRLTFSVGNSNAVKMAKVQFITDGEKSILL